MLYPITAPLRQKAGEGWSDRRPIGKISAKCCSFSAVSAPIFARKYAFLAMITCFTRYTMHTLSKIVLYAEITYDKKTFRCLEHEPLPLSRRYLQFHDSVTFVFSLLFKRSRTVLRNTFQRKGRNVSYGAKECSTFIIPCAALD